MNDTLITQIKKLPFIKITVYILINSNLLTDYKKLIPQIEVLL